MRSKFLALLGAASLAALVAACGGSDTATVASSTTISGNAVKGPVVGGIVTVRAASTGAVIGTTTTSVGGSYNLSVPYTGDVIVEVAGGSYVDESTAANTTLTTPLRVVLAANGGSVTGVATPLTTMAYTYAFGNNTSGVSAATFNTQAGRVATQFNLTGVNLATSVPVVSGTVNDYGRALQGVSKYLQLNSTNLQSVVNSTFTTAQWADFSTKYTTAYRNITGNNTASFTFDGTQFTIGGTGAGGGTGTCGVHASGTINANVGGQSISQPFSFDYCVTGIAAGSCSSTNGTLAQALNGQQGVTGSSSVNYTFGSVCAAGAIPINLVN